MPNIVAKILGADFELANALYTPGTNYSRADRAARLLLAEIPGYPERRHLSGTAIEYGRRFLVNGGAAYIDSDHAEFCTPEHVAARDHELHVHAALRIAHAAQIAAQEQLPRGTRLDVLANNCDGHVSYGAHLNVMTTSRTFDDILYRKPHLGALLATHLVTSVLFTGQGMVGGANGLHCDYQLSQRADWFETYANSDTMQRRPLLNTRNEAHSAAELARLHIIYLDMALAPLANLLRAGTTQLVVALCEAGLVDPGITLDDPVEAASVISRDLSLRQTYATAARGRRWTAIDIQQAIHDLAAELVASGAVEEAVPHADEILRQWQTTLDLLRQRDLDRLAQRCDNWLKYLLLERYRSGRGLTWSSPELKMLDLRYSSLNPDEGLFFQMTQAGCIENWPDSGDVERFVHQPPDDTRAWLRGKVLQRYGREVSNLDWSWIDFRVPTHRGWCSVARLEMNDPRRFTRAECESLVTHSTTLDELVEGLTPEPEPSRSLACSPPSNGHGSVS